MPLNSKTNLKLIDAICEGPIEGLTHHRKSVYLNETQVTFEQIKSETEDERPAVYIEQRQGSKDQDRFGKSSGFSNSSTVLQPVGLQVGQNYSETPNENNVVTPGNRNYGEGQIIQEIQDPDVDFVKLIFTIRGLFCRAVEGLARGQLFSAQIKLRIRIQDQAGNFEEIAIGSIGTSEENVIRGISTSDYQFETQEIDISDFQAPVKIKVEKLKFEPDPEAAFEITLDDLEDLPGNTPLASNRSDTIIWSSIVVGKRIRTAYPHTALVFLSLDSEEYNTLPARSYEVKGKKVKIPSNATVNPNGSLKFEPDDVPFDGSLKKDLYYTTCPVCCFYDMATNNRYGAGDFIDASKLSWIDLIDIARYCNEEVSTPDGSEPRFAINTAISSQAEAYNVMQDLASVFRGMLFWKADTVQVAADHGELKYGDVDAIHVFSNSNVVNGSFVYSGSSLKTRSTRVRVRYNDPDNFYKPNFIIIEDQVLIDKYGIQEKNVVAFGCTSKHQAQRMGRWIMQSEKLHDETIAFSVGLEGLNVLPGQMFEVSDEMRFATRLAGRIVGAGLNFVDLDQTAVLPAGSNNKLTVVMPDGTVETRDIASVSGVRVTLSSNFSQTPADDALYAIKNDLAKLAKYRCLSIAEGEDGVYSIVGVKHVDGIYSSVEKSDFDLTLPDPFFYSGKPEKPQNPRITFQQIDDGRNTTNRATISWTRGLTGSVIEFKVQYKIGDGGNWITVFTSNNSIDIDKGLVPGKRLYAKIKSIGPEPDRRQTANVFVNRVIGPGGTSDDPDGLTTVVLPPDPEDVTIELVGSDQVVLRWASTASGQKLESFVAHIRHSSKTDGSGTWPNSTLIAKVEARTTAVTLPLLNGEYLVKFVNDQKQRSANAGSAVINVPDAVPKYNYEVYREDSSPGEFPGQKTNVFYSSEYDGLIFDGNASFDDITSVDDFTDSIDSLFGTQFSSGEYIFQKIVDLGAKFNVRLLRTLAARGLYKSDLIDDRTELIDTWSDFDGDIPDDTNVEMYFRKSDSAATDSVFVKEDGDRLQLEDGDDIRQQSDLVFEDWIPLENNAYVGRSFQFKAVLKTDHLDQTPLIDQLGVSVQLERRTESSGILQSGLGTRSVSFEKPFYVDADTTVAVGITALDMEAGDYFELSEPTATGFTIRFRTSLGDQVSVAKRFSYTAVGYGTQQA